MVRKRKPHLSSDKLAYLCTCFTKDMSPVLNRLRHPFFHLLIARLIRNWCENRGEDVDFCILEIQRLTTTNNVSIQTATNTTEIDGKSAVATDVIEITERNR